MLESSPAVAGKGKKSTLFFPAKSGNMRKCLLVISKYLERGFAFQGTLCTIVGFEPRVGVGQLTLQRLQSREGAGEQCGVKHQGSTLCSLPSGCFCSELARCLAQEGYDLQQKRKEEELSYCFYLSMWFSTQAKLSCPEYVAVSVVTSQTHMCQKAHKLSFITASQLSCNQL